MAPRDEKYLRLNDVRTPAQVAEDRADEYLSSHRPTERAAMGQLGDALAQDRRDERDERADNYLSSGRASASTWRVPRLSGFHQVHETPVIIPLNSGEQGHAADRRMD